MKVLVIPKGPHPVSNRTCNGIGNQNKIIFYLFLYHYFLIKNSSVRLEAERDGNTSYSKESLSRI